MRLTPAEPRDVRLITHGTTSSALTARRDNRRRKPVYAVVVDGADSILNDEARTLILVLLTATWNRWYVEFVARLLKRDEDYVRSIEKKKTVVIRSRALPRRLGVENPMRRRTPADWL